MTIMYIMAKTEIGRHNFNNAQRIVDTWIDTGVPQPKIQSYFWNVQFYFEHTPLCCNRYKNDNANKSLNN